MPALTITAVDHTNDLLTIAAHGLSTGAGPAVVRNPTGALPTGLAAVTDYWIIVVDSNNIKLASSSANAMANTPINLTANGSGTNILELGIPYTRARTYVPAAVDAAGAQVKSADLNSLMDAFKALYRLLTGQAQTLWSAIVIAVGLTLAPNQHITVSGTGRYKHGEIKAPLAGFAGAITSGATAFGTSGNWPFANIPNSSALWLPIPVPIGKRLKAIEVLHFNDVETVTYNLYQSGGAVAFSSSGTNPLLLTLTTPGTSLDNGADSVWWLKISTNASGVVDIFNVLPVVDDP